MRDFGLLIQKRWAGGRFVCVGLDLDLGRAPAPLRGITPRDALFSLGRELIDSTADIVAAYKPNIAYFEQYAADGLDALRSLIDYTHHRYPDIPVIVDAKRADIASTNDGYVKAIFGDLQADATTLHPYLGAEALRPFLDVPGKGLFVLCRTSNPGAGELQDLAVDGEPLYLHLARKVVRSWTSESVLGLVVGATFPAELERVRSIAPSSPLLIPGVGAQGGDLDATVRAAVDPAGVGFLINSSRAIIFASDGEDFAEAARTATLDLHGQISQILESVKS